MSAETVRKAIVDAVLTVQDCVKAYGTKETARKDWATISRAKAEDVASVPAEEREQYRETFEIAARHAAALVASLN